MVASPVQGDADEGGQQTDGKRYLLQYVFHHTDPRRSASVLGPAIGTRVGGFM
jgi:hypothetical protein